MRLATMVSSSRLITPEKADSRSAMAQATTPNSATSRVSDVGARDHGEAVHQSKGRLGVLPGVVDARHENGTQP